jgi:hypothetical protein
MRIFTIDRSTLSTQDLQAKLFKPDAAGGASLQALQKLNPQVDFTRLTEGTVLLLPDPPVAGAAAAADAAGAAAAAGTAPGAQSFATVGTDFGRALDASRARMSTLADRSSSAQKALAAALKPAPMKARVKADPELQIQVDAANERARRDAKTAAENLKVLEKAHDRARKELAELAKLFG